MLSNHNMIWTYPSIILYTHLYLLNIKKIATWAFGVGIYVLKQFSLTFLIINKRVLFHENKCVSNMTLCKVHKMH